jgi:hypothetical protein
MDDKREAYALEKLSSARIALQRDKIQLWTAWIELAAKAIALVTVVSSVVGFIYLLMYCVSEHLPVPVSLSQLPLLVLFLTLFGSATVVAIAGFAFLPAWERGGVFGDGIKVLWEPRTTDSRSIWWKAGPYLLSVSLPAWLVQVWFYFGALLDWPTWVLTSTFAIGPICIGLMLGTVHCTVAAEERERVLFTVGLLAFIKFFWLVCLSLLFIKFLAGVAPHTNTYLGLALLILLSTAAVVVASAMVLAKRGRRVRTPALILFAGMLVMLPPLFSPLAIPIAGYSLRTLRVGGGFSASFVLKKEAVGQLPRELVATVDAKDPAVVTVPLLVGMVSSDAYWVRPEGKTAGWFELHRDQTLMEKLN